MSTHAVTTEDEQGSTTSGGSNESPETLRAQLELLEEENRRLREEYVRARQTSYRRTAGGLALIGGIAVIAAVLFPSVRDVLLVLGAIGLFGGVLTYYLTPEQFVAAETGERIARAQDETHGAIAEHLGLTPIQVYVPVEGAPPARLFVPQHDQYEIPAEQDLDQPFVIGDTERERGVSFVPAGVHLVREFEQTLTGQRSDTPKTAATQLADGLVEGFELAKTADVDVDTENGRATVQIDGGVYSGLDWFENPLASFLGVGLTQALEQPVRTELAAGDTEHSLIVTCRWPTPENGSSE